MIRSLSLAVAFALLGSAVVQAQEKQTDKPAPKVTFKRTQLDGKFRSEGVAVADFNKDGKLDIAAGFVWYEAPEWKMHQLTEKLPEYDPKGYSNAFCCFAEDVNGDGWSDLLVVDFPGTPTWWFENPKETGKLWPKHTVTPVTNNESPQYLDIDGDGKRELLFGFAPTTKDSDGPDRQVGFAKPTKDPKEPWTLHAISDKGVQGAKKYDHGLGLGDINGDKRLDVMVASGWFEAPANASEMPWKFHAANFGQAAQMYAYDFDGDGDNDVITSSPHAFGLWWHEQVGPNQWKQHEISKEFSQIHGVMLADMNGDKLPDIVCGKRWWAHAAGDPGVNDPAVFYWFELKREAGRPVWTPHQFDHNSGPGTQFEVADVNGDVLLDVISSNKKGVHYFEQSRE
jgi:hypothetical protein